MSEFGDVDVARAWMTLAGLLVVPMLALVPLARLARDGLRGVASEQAHGLERVSGAAVFACTWLWLLSAFGAALRDKTHQRALGAVTFAIFAVVTLVFVALVARRLVVILVALGQRRRDIGTAVAIVALVLSLALLGLRVARAAPSLTFGGRATLVDGFAVALAVAFGARKAFEGQRVLARVGPPLAACLIVVALHTLLTSASATSTLELACPVYFALIRRLVGNPT